MIEIETLREGWSDFMQVATLARRAGCSAGDLALVAAKEIVDNAMDASPAGVEVEFRDRTLIVRDCGPGLSQEQIWAIFDIRRQSLSSKRWRLAKRGALGNGVRVIMGVVHVSGGSLTVESRGVGMVLDVAMDGTTRTLKRFASDVDEGARVGLMFGPAIEVDPAVIVEHAALCQAGAGSAFGGSKAVPTWFDAPAVRELLRDAPAGTSVLDFARNFDLAVEALAEIKSAALRVTTADLLANDQKLAIVTRTILAGQKGDRRLRPMGRNARVGAYASVEITFQLGGAALPARVEVWVRGQAVQDRKTDGDVTVATLFANRTPALMRAGSGHVLAGDKCFSVWLGNAFFHIETVLSGPCDFEIDLAITAPELPLVSDGKAVDIAAFADPIEAALRAALPKAYVRPTGKVAAPTSTAISVKAAVYAVIADAYESVAAAGIGAPPRMLMYKCRPTILRLTGRNELNYATFNAALQYYMDDNPETTANWSILYDDRGHFIEPGGSSFGLGTLAVEKFIRAMSAHSPRFMPEIGLIELKYSSPDLAESGNPSLRFGAVVFIEKEGYRELIRKSGIAERFDVAFASTKGLPNTSIRRLLDELSNFGIKVFVLHDLDITGLNIAHTISNSNERYRFQNDLDVHDMGVRLHDAEALGLQSEPFRQDERVDRQKLRARLERYGATPGEIRMLVDEARRVEIDAMDVGQLVNFIEQKLEAAGVGKIVPPEEAMAAHFAQAVSQIRIDRALIPLRAEFDARAAEFAEDLRAGTLLDINVPPLRDAVRLHLQINRDDTWRDAVEAFANELEGA